MPAETHRLGSRATVEDVLVLLGALLGDEGLDDPDHATLAALGVDKEGLVDLWEAVCEEFCERTLGPDLDPDVIGLDMSVTAAAAAMAALVASGPDGDS
ncbi:MAG: hypothetical protein ACRDYB_13265 [Acidimicrobiales bacterium]